MNPQKLQSSLARLRPYGQLVVLDAPRAAMVYPLGAKHLSLFSKDLVRAVGALTSIEIPKNSNDQQLAAVIAQSALPILLHDCMDLIRDTVVVGSVDENETFTSNSGEEAQIDILPHWDLPTILEAWVDLSFGEKRKRDPWIGAINKVLQKLTGKKISIMDYFSSRYTQPGLDPTSSLNDNSKVSPTEG